ADRPGTASLRADSVPSAWHRPAAGRARDRACERSVRRAKAANQQRGRGAPLRGDGLSRRQRRRDVHARARAPAEAGVSESRNVEIKARITSVAAIAPRVAVLADRGPIEIEQDDTFFVCERGRLKLRALSPSEGQLIFYRRANQAGPKESRFVISPTGSPDSLREALGRAYGSAGRVRKHRTLYLVGRTRVHLDRVDGL